MVKPMRSLFLNLADGLHYGADGAYEVVGHHCQAVWAFAGWGPHLSGLWVPPPWGPRTLGNRQGTFNHSLQANVQHDPQVDLRRYLGRSLHRVFHSSRRPGNELEWDTSTYLLIFNIAFGGSFRSKTKPVCGMTNIQYDGPWFPNSWASLWERKFLQRENR